MLGIYLLKHTWICAEGPLKACRLQCYAGAGNKVCWWLANANGHFWGCETSTCNDRRWSFLSIILWQKVGDYQRSSVSSQASYAFCIPHVSVPMSSGRHISSFVNRSKICKNEVCSFSKLRVPSAKYFGNGLQPVRDDPIAASFKSKKILDF